MSSEEMAPITDERAAARNAHPAFVEYYQEESLTNEAIVRFKTVRDKALRLARRVGERLGALDVLGIGCGAGTECRIWAELGHRVTGIDISEPLITIARERATKDGQNISFHVGSALALPYQASAFDVCLIPQLLEHVPDWRTCLDESVRVLCPGGVLYLSTTNVICPAQNEFTLPLYSWYPGFVKRKCEEVAVTTRPEWVCHTSYPAVHWFTYWQLRDYLVRRGLVCFDRFDLATADTPSRVRKTLLRVIHWLPPLRAMAYLLVTGTIIFGVKR